MDYLGIDPGIGGGLVELVGEGTLLRADKMPESDEAVWNWISNVQWTRTVAMLETIAPAIGAKWTNKSGVAQTSAKGSMSKLYGSYRALRMALVIAGITIDEVKSGDVWRCYNIPPRGKTESRTAWKGRLKAKAQSLFPRLKVTLAISDALLFAEFCRRKHEGLTVSKMTPRPDTGEVL